MKDQRQIVQLNFDKLVGALQALTSTVELMPNQMLLMNVRSLILMQRNISDTLAALTCELDQRLKEDQCDRN